MVNKIVWAGNDINKVLSSKLDSDEEFGKLEFNSREITPGDIFIAMKSQKGDGHQYVSDAFSNGARAVIVEKDFEFSYSNKFLIRVNDTNQSLIDLANYKRKNSKAKFIGITGSVGKTSVKEILGFLLKNYTTTFVSKGNYNNHIGVPLSLCSIPKDAVYSVNEMGMSAKGEISYLTSLVKPDIAIITKIAPAHLEFFNSVEDICRAKCEIFESLNEGGIAIINRDDNYYELQKDIALSCNIQNIYSFGEHPESDLRLIEYKIVGESSVVKFTIDDKLYQVTWNVKGKHQALNLCCSMLSIYLMGLDMQRAIKIAQNVKLLDGRGGEILVSKNGKSFKLIDDSYNANPESVKASLENFKIYQNITPKELENISENQSSISQLNLGFTKEDLINLQSAHAKNIKINKVAVLSDMLELGNTSETLHRNLAGYVISSGVSKLITVGNLMKNLSDELRGKIDVIHFNEINNETIVKIENLIEEDDIVLVKGSRGTNLWKFVDYLLEKK